MEYSKSSPKREVHRDIGLPQKNKKNLGDFPGGPVVKILRFHCRGRGFNPWLGTKIPHTVRRSQKKKQKQRKTQKNLK